MKKIMFDNHYGLENAVLNGSKTMTRRILKPVAKAVKEIRIIDGRVQHRYGEVWFPATIEDQPKYRIGDVVAIAQSYESLVKDVYHGQEENFANRILEAHGRKKIAEVFGWTNKMYVCADLMPHQIRITDIKIERLQDISDVDCMKEGVYIKKDTYFDIEGFKDGKAYCLDVTRKQTNTWFFPTPKLAFEGLIRKMYGKKVWDDNPYVFVYTFELVK